MSCYSQQISFRYWKRHGNRNTKSRHHNRINKFSEFHGGYISEGRVLSFRIYFLSYSEDYYQKEISEFQNHSFILHNLLIFISQSPNSLTLYLSVA